MNHYTQTPVNAAWLVMVLAGICGTLGFSATALSSLAGYAIYAFSIISHANIFCFTASASVIGLYTSYSAPIFLRITSGRNKLVPGPFTLGKWYMPIGIIAVVWVQFITVLLLFPPGSNPPADEMSEFLNNIICRLQY